MNLIQGKSKSGKTMELVKRFMEDENPAILSIINSKNTPTSKCNVGGR